MENVVIITYPNLHRKTQDLCLCLKAKYKYKLNLLVLPYTYTKRFSPIYQHRPSKTFNTSLEEFCTNLGIALTISNYADVVEDLKNFTNPKILIGGAGLLPNSLIETFDIINAHPALLPENRGLDALKWGIINKSPIGVTTHIIDTTADAGWLMDQKLLEVKSNDTFHSYARNLYELEIEMLADSVLCPILKNDTNRIIPNKKQAPNKRMPKKLEQNLMQLFEEYKGMFAKE